MKVTRTITLDFNLNKELKRRGENVSGLIEELLTKHLALPILEGEPVSLEQARAVISAADEAASLESARTEQAASALEARKKLCMEVYGKNAAAQADLDAKQQVYKESYSTYEEMAPLRSEMQSLQSVIATNLALAGFNSQKDMRIWMMENGLISE